MLPASALLSSRPRDGLVLSVRGGATLCLLAACLRCVPAALSQAARGDAGRSTHAAALACVHVAQFINAAVAPLIVASPAALSRAWFPPRLRNTATAVANVANAAGRGVGFFLGPALVSAPEDLPRLLAAGVAASALPALAVWLYYPEPPAGGQGDVSPGGGGGGWGSGDAHAAGTPLLLAGDGDDDAALWRHSGGGGSGSGSSGMGVRAALVSALSEARTAVGVRSFVLVAVSGGAIMAVWGAWSGVLATVLSPRFSSGQVCTPVCAACGRGRVWACL